MTPVPESLVAEVVSDAAKRLSDAHFTETTVGDFVARQGRITQYLTAKATKLGGAHGVVQTVFHAAILLQCAQRHSGRHIAQIGFDVLDEVARKDSQAELKKRQPAFGEYIVSNVETEEAQKALFIVALAIDSMV